LRETAGDFFCPRDGAAREEDGMTCVARPSEPATSLHCTLGLIEVTAGGVGIIIGALTGLSYAELSSMFPSAAGEYEYTRRAMPEWIASVQVGGLVLIVGIGLPYVGDVDLVSGPGVSGVLGAAALVFFAFIGFDEVITLAEETRDPTSPAPSPFLALFGACRACR
jgi:amino acid transporter